MAFLVWEFGVCVCGFVVFVLCFVLFFGRERVEFNTLALISKDLNG